MFVLYLKDSNDFGDGVITPGADFTLAASAANSGGQQTGGEGTGISQEEEDNEVSLLAAKMVRQIDDKMKISFY